MVVDRTFLGSKVGRRMFVALLLAAAVPIVFFGALSYRELSDHASTQAQRQLTSATKDAALSALNRMILARAVLGVMSRQGAPKAEKGATLEGGRALSAVSVLAPDGRLLAGDPRLAELWRSERPSAAGAGASTGELWWPRTEGPPASIAVPVIVSRQAPDGSLWLAEIDRDYLFSPLAADMPDGHICVFDMKGTVISCPSSALDRARQRLHDHSATPAEGTASWSLFLRAEFGVEDWALVTLVDAHRSVDASTSVARSAVQVALATLLVVTLLSLVQIRRTTVPLERLIGATRLWRSGEFGARVAVDRDDEFGELAGSLNQMAGQIGRQIDALKVQSTIDAEILDRLDVPHVMQRVVQRIETLLPGAEVVVVEIGAAQKLGSIVHHRAATSHLLAVPEEVVGSDADADGWKLWRDGDSRPDWLHRLPLAWKGDQDTLAVVARGALLAWIVIAWPRTTSVDAECRREVCELRDRVGVTLAAAQRELQLVSRATTDSLTGLLNRVGLAEALDKHLARHPRNDAAPLNMLFIDLDRFKDVNDALGHQAGDELLCVVARRLVDCAPTGTVAARPGGDEYVLLVPGSMEEATATATRICRVLSESLPLRGQGVSVGASIGLARYPDHGVELADLMRRADMAMYQAKANGRGTHQWFEPAFDARQSERVAILQDLLEALARGQFELHYQPRLSAHDGHVCSVEALIRWRHPTRGLVMPAHFIDLLEETGLIDSVGHWTLVTACRQLQSWREVGIALDCVSVNVSPRQLRMPNFATQVLATLASAHLAASDVELEVTEGLFVDKSDATIAELQRLRDAGMRIAIDDFGTGYSSLSYLHRLPFDVLKVDRSFVMEIGVTPDAESITRAIVALALTLKKRVVAEGVETGQQANHLLEIGCHELQGYLYSRPLTPQALVAWLEQRKVHSALEPATVD